MSTTRRRFIAGIGAVGAGAVLVPQLRSLLAVDAQPVYRHVPVLGTRVSFAVRHPDARVAERAIRHAVRAVFDVHESMTLHEPSPLSWLNDSGLDQVHEVPACLWDVLCASRDLHAQTGGLFDATMGHAIRRLTAPNEGGVPAEGLLEGAGWANVITDDARRTVAFAHPNTALDFNGVAKGYAVDLAAAELRRAGIKHFLVNAGGDLYAAGSSSESTTGWPIHLESMEPGHAPLRTFMVSDQAVATSGNSFRPKRADGQRIEHLIHPGLGAPGGEYVTATAIADTAMQADAWATAAFVGAPADLAARLPSSGGPELHFVDRAGRLTRISA